MPHALVRLVEVLDGELTVCMDCEPKLEYGLAAPRFARDREHAVATCGGPERLFLRSDVALRIEGSTASSRVRLAAGERAAWVVHRRAGTYAPSPDPLDARATLEDSAETWRSWSREHGGYEGAQRDRVQFAGLVFQGLTYQPTGALVAAATTSLPEVPGGQDNWDYRYGWLRDASMTARALSASTCPSEARRYFDWMVRAAVTGRAEEQVQIVFGVDGERDLSEHRLEHLDGHLRSRPARIATRRGARSSSTCSATCSTARGSSATSSAHPIRSARGFCVSSPTARRANGASPTPASGKDATASATTSCRRWAAGSPSIARCASPTSSA